MFGLHLILAVGLAAFAGAMTPHGVAGAFILVYLVLRAGGGLFGVRAYLGRFERGVGFAGWFVLEVLKASYHVARIILRRKVAVSPAVVEVRLRSRDERRVTVIAMLVTLTPGTLAIDCDAAGGVLFVHALNAASQAEVQRSVGELEARLLAWIGERGPVGGQHDG